MATYVPGSKAYLPDIKPFTPDFKFLSAVLDQRQDKYTTSWKATNEVYNKVVYADLSRQDTTEQRDQYIETLGPSLEKIAGMDLSLAQNADSAKAVFAPFFEDKLIVKDMVYTANYRKQMDYANRLLQSNNQEQREKYWNPGIKALQYRMEDFVNGSADEAMNASLARYVEDADLIQMSEKILSEMDPPLKIKMDHFGTNPDGTVNTDFIITTQNGELVTGPAFQYIQTALADDPRVQQAYQTSAYVESRDRAAELMQAGQAASVQQGQEMWANERIALVTAANQEQTKGKKKQLAEDNKTNENWAAYQKDQGIIPGSDEDKEQKDNLSAYEATKAELEQNMKIEQIAQTPVGEGLESNLSRAYELTMLFNMDRDMKIGAQNYSMRDFESSMEANPYAVAQKKHMMDMQKVRFQARERRNLEQIKQQNRIDLAKAKGEILSPEQQAQQDALMKALGQTVVKRGEANTTELPDGAVVVAVTEDQFIQDDNKLLVREVDAILNSYVQINPNGDNGNQEWTIDFNGTQITGSIETLRNQMLKQEDLTTKQQQDGVVADYENREAINAAFTGRYEFITNAEGVKSKNPSYQQSAQWANLNNDFLQLRTDKTVLDRNFQSATQTHYNTYEQTKVRTLKDDDEVKAQMEAGFGDIYDNTDPDNVRLLSKAEYVAAMVEKAEANQLINIGDEGLMWGRNNVPEGEGNDFTDKNYRKTKTRYVDGSGSYSSYGIGGFSTGNTGYYEPVLDANGNEVKEVNVWAVKKHAEEVYDRLAEDHNKGLTAQKGWEGYETATLKSVQMGRQNLIGEIETGVTYGGNIDPKVSGSAGNKIYTDLLNQIAVMEGAGQNPQYYAGEIGIDSDMDDQLEGTDLALYKRALNAYRADMLNYVTNEKAGNSISTMPRASIEYKPVYGDPEAVDKTKAGNIITFGGDWLESKKAGSETTGEYGTFSQIEINKLKKGISILFDQKDDISSRSAANSAIVSSPIISEIMASQNHYVEYKPIYGTKEDGNVNTGTLRFVQNSPTEYMMNWQFNEYVEGGSYRMTPIRSRTISLPAGTPYDGTLETLKKALIEKEFNPLGAENLRRRKKDKAVNAKK